MENLETARMILDAMVKEDGVNWQQTRQSAASIIGSLPDHFEDQLQTLLEDADIEVESKAIAAVGKLRKERFISHLLERLNDPRVQPVITEALATFGDPIVETLSDRLLDTSLRIELRRQIPGVLLRIGTPEAERVLVESLLEEDTLLRLRIVSSLNKLRNTHPELEMDTNLIETLLAAEIIGHYRSYQILGSLGGELERDDTVARAVGEAMKEELERIFRLMQLLFPVTTCTVPTLGFNRRMRWFTITLLSSSTTFSSRKCAGCWCRCWIAKSASRSGELANRLVGTKVETREEVVAALMHSQDPWLKSCAAYAIGILGLNFLERT